MKPDFFLIIGLVVNTLFAVLYPAQIFGDDPLGISGETNQEVSTYFSVNGTSVLTGYDSETGQLQRDDSLFTKLGDAATSTDGDSGIFTTDVFGFVDWVKIGFGLIKAIIMFIVGFVYLLWTLVYPLNFLIGIPFSVMYLFSIASFIIGR